MVVSVVGVSNSGHRALQPTKATGAGAARCWPGRTQRGHGASFAPLPPELRVLRVQDQDFGVFLPKAGCSLRAQHVSTRRSPTPSGSKDASPASILNAKGVDNIRTCTKPYAQRTSDIWICIARTIRLKLLHHQVTLPGYKLEYFPMRQSVTGEKPLSTHFREVCVYGALLQHLVRRHFS